MMSDENKSCCPTPDAEPTVTRSAAPMWIIVVTLTLLFFGGLYLDSHGGWFDARVYQPFNSAEKVEAFQPKSGAASMMALGKARYEAICGICHGTDGLGKPGMAPPLAGSEWVNAKGHNRLAHITLTGLIGPINVAGKEWNMSMAAMGASLPDDDLAAVLTYIRSSWGNKAAPVTGDDIKAIRAQLGTGGQPISGAQLMQVPE
jgi:mono/diheme cytochrome c family protein